jgi:ABC-2 type transport system permease protein
MNPFRRYRRFTRNSVSRLLSYRANVLLYIFGSILQTVVLFYLWRAVYSSSGEASLHGFSFPEMVFYLVATTATLAVTRVDAGELIADEVREGSIAMNLVRPIDYRCRVFFDALGTSAYNMVFVGLPAIVALLLIGASYAGEAPRLAMAPFGLALLSSFLLNFVYSFCFGLLAFVTTNMWGMARLEMVVATLLSGGLIPLVFFPDWLRGVAGFLPWASMAYVPVMALLGKLEGVGLLRALALQAAWILFFWWLSGFAWDRLLRRLAVNGG